MVYLSAVWKIKLSELRSAVVDTLVVENWNGDQWRNILSVVELLAPSTHRRL